MSLLLLSTHPDYTLKLMAEIIKESSLKRIMNDNALAVTSEEEAKELLQHVYIYRGRRKGAYINYQ